MSVGAITNWTGNLIVVIITPYLYSAAGGYMWLIYSMFALTSIIFFSIFLKETKGLSEEDVKKLYRVNHVEGDQSQNQNQELRGA